jgi:hypothetical protein
LSEPANFFIILLHRKSAMYDAINLWPNSRLRGRTDTRHGKTNVDGGTDTTEEEFSLQEDLTVSDGNDLWGEHLSKDVSRQPEKSKTHVGGNVGGHITTLGLNDGESSEGSSTEIVIHLGSTLEETRVEVEDVTRVSLTTGRTTEKEGHLTVGDSLLGQIVVDDEG